MPGYTYTTLKSTLAAMIVKNVANADYVTIIDPCIEDSEQRCYRDLDMQAVVYRDTTLNFGVNTRVFTLPTPTAGRFVVVEEVNAIINGARSRLTPVSMPYLNEVWPQDTAPATDAVPNRFAMLSDSAILVGPPLGSAAGTATAEVVGRIRPNPLSATNTTTVLSLYYPDLLLAACMVFLTGWMKNFGAQADDPKMAVSWETQYRTKLASANLEEARKRFASMDWQSYRPEPAAEAMNAQ